MKKFIICQIILALLATLHVYIVDFLSIERNLEEFDFGSDTEKYVTALIIAPLFESVVFNMMPVEILSKIIKQKNIVILLSSIAFGLIHYFDIYYIIFGFLGGVIYNFKYLDCRNNSKNIIYSLCTIILLHFNHNLIGLILGF